MLVILDVSEYQSVGQLDQLLKSADDEIVLVYIKATQGLSYRDSLARAFAECCQHHNTPFGYYDFMTNDQAVDQEAYFKTFVSGQPVASVIPLLDCEGSYAKYSAGVEHWEAAYGGKVAGYASLSAMPNYAALNIPKIVAQYDSTQYYRPTQSEIDAYTAQGYSGWQFTSNYMGLNQDASVLLTSLEDFKA